MGERADEMSGRLNVNGEIVDLWFPLPKRDIQISRAIGVNIRRDVSSLLLSLEYGACVYTSGLQLQGNCSVDKEKDKARGTHTKMEATTEGGEVPGSNRVVYRISYPMSYLHILRYITKCIPKSWKHYFHLHLTQTPI